MKAAENHPSHKKADIRRLTLFSGCYVVEIASGPWTMFLLGTVQEMILWPEPFNNEIKTQYMVLPGTAKANGIGVSKMVLQPDFAI